MTRVGIIANPASGRDIRRLVALGTVVGIQDKVNTVRRVLAGLEAAGVEEIHMMPDAHEIGRQAKAKHERPGARLYVLHWWRVVYSAASR